MIWERETSYDAMDHRTVFGEYHCGTHVYRGGDMAEVEGVTRKANLKQPGQRLLSRESISRCATCSAAASASS
jgi:hypothetical protein